MELKLVNSVSKKEYLFAVEDTNSSILFWNFNLKLKEDMDDGEFVYTLFDDESNECARGLLQIGDFKPEKTEYENKNDNGYIVYGG